MNDVGTVEPASMDRYLRTFDSACHKKPEALSAQAHRILLTFGKWWVNRAITVLIGPQAKQYCVHEELLKASSQHFKAALEGGCQEAKNGVFKLDEENACIFELFLDWIYHGKIYYTTKYLDADLLLVELYLFGERRGCAVFQNEVVDEIASFLGKGDCEMTPEAVFLLFSETTASSKVRRFIAEKIAWEGDAEKLLKQYREAAADVHPEFGLAVYGALLERLTTDATYAVYTSCGSSKASSTSTYHSHNFRCNLPCCGKTPEMALKGTSSKRIAGAGQAPYLKRAEFCSRYHIHATGEKGCE